MIVPSYWRTIFTVAVLSIAASAFAATPAESSWKVKTANTGGSATTIGPRLAVTASHVVADTAGTKVTLHRADRKPIAGEVIAAYKLTDVALIRLAEEVADYVPLASADPVDGSSVQAVGFGMSNVLRGASGTARPIQHPRHVQVKQLMADIICESGDSGGGIFNDKGELAGVICWVDGAANYVSSGGYVVSSGRVGFTPSSYVTALQNYYEVQCQNGMCHPRSMGSGGSGLGQRMSPLPQPAPRSDGLTPLPQPCPPQDSGLASRLDKIEQQLKKLAEHKPEPGPPGPPGPPGRDGRDGCDAQLSQADLDRMLTEKPLTVQIVDPSGKVIQETKAHLGGDPLRFQLVPVPRGTQKFGGLSASAR